MYVTKYLKEKYHISMPIIFPLELHNLGRDRETPRKSIFAKQTASL